MRTKRLVENILKAISSRGFLSRGLVSGGVLVVVSLDVSASSFYSDWYNDVSRAFQQHYQVRSFSDLERYPANPVNAQRPATHPGQAYTAATGYARHSSHSTQYRYANRAINQVQTPVNVRARYQYRQAPRSMQPSVPAFARMYGWTSQGRFPVKPVGSASQQTVVKKVSGREFFSSSVNSQVQTSPVQTQQVPEYRSAPVNTQGFRYRKHQRNPNFVSFTDRIGVRKPPAVTNNFRQQYQATQQTRPVNDYPHAIVNTSPVSAVTDHLRPVSHSASSASNRFAVSNNSMMLLPRPVNSSHRQTQPQPMALPTPAVPMPVAPQNTIPSSTLNNDPFHFRPDLRFVPENKSHVVGQVPASEQPLRLVDAKIKKTGDNFADKWTFRPVDSSF